MFAHFHSDDLAAHAEPPLKYSESIVPDLNFFSFLSLFHPPPREQVNEADRLSVSVCHACISYLNSWQSFKNRCDAAQRKLKIWLSAGDNKSQTASTGQSLLKTQLNGHGNQLKPAIENAKQKFQETQAELQRKKLVQLQQQQAKHPIDTSFIKSEPASDDDVSRVATALEFPN